jgi:NifU-like protein involved in Fe-S cluster formation
MDPVREQLLKNMGFSEKAIAILDQNLNMGKPEDASVSAQHQGACGDILFLFLKINQDIISEARFEYIGCAGLQVCASALTELVKGLTLAKAGQLEARDIIDYLESIPQRKYECAEISRDTLRKALAIWQQPTLKVI